MRIAGGKYKSRIFKPNKKFTARPTTDLAKEGLFNILENRYDFAGKTALDLFSGTGSIGYGFISRGCEEVSFVEKDFNHFRFIQDVIKNLNIENARIIKGDVFIFVFKFTGKFDFIFADPPFELPWLKEIPKAIFDADILTENGLFVLEHPKNYEFTKHQNFKELRNYGKVNFSFFEA